MEWSRASPVYLLLIGVSAMDFMTLVIIVAIVLVVLKLIKATVKVMVMAVIGAAILWAILNFAPGASAATAMGVIACLSA